MTLAEKTYLSYLTLAQTTLFDNEQGLGGKLLYSGEICHPDCALLYAANIAGSASISASADPATQRQALRDGAIDFLVTSLEEALRILKNEIRKHNTVSVGVGIAPAALVSEMLNHGVLPDLLGPQTPDLFGAQQKQFEVFQAQGAIQLGFPELILRSGAAAKLTYARWSAERNFARWLPLLDKCAQSVVPAQDNVRQRWLQLAARYLGRLAQREHGVALSQSETERLKDQAAAALAQNATQKPQDSAIRLNGEPIFTPKVDGIDAEN